MNDPIIEFNPKLPKLSKNEKVVLKLLVEVGKLIAPIYLEQEKQPVFSKDEIEKAAKKNPAILSPYTVVEKRNGKLVTIPYHIKYVNLLKPVAKKLEEASKITENKAFGNALKIQAKALLDGSYGEVIASRLKSKPYILDIAIGPIQYHSARLPLGKASYQAWVGILDKEGTDRLNNYKTITLAARRRVFLPKERIESKKIITKVLDVILLSGLMAKTKFVGLNLPTDLDLIEKYGSEVVLFNQPNDLRIKEQILPAFNKYFSKEFRQGFNEEDLRRGYLRSVALHELAHSYLFYKNSEKNLQNLFFIIYELAATILGLRLAGSLLLIDRINDKQLESMMIALISRGLYLIEKRKKSKLLLDYAVGYTIFINFLIESGALKRLNNLITPNFTKIFVSLHDLSSILENLLARGSRQDAEFFIKKYSLSSPRMY